MGKSGKCQGILWGMPMILSLSQSYTFMFLILVPCMDPGGKILTSFLMLWYHDISPYKSFLKRKYVCWAQLSRLRRETYYLVLQINFHLNYREAKSVNYVLKSFISIFGQWNFGKENNEICFNVSHWGGSTTQDDFFLVSYKLQPISCISDAAVHWYIYMSLNESIDFIVTVIHYINRVVSLADASYLLDKAGWLSPAAENLT